MRVIRASEHAPVPWKNGGGAATMIVGEPEAGGFEVFDWRLSGACVAKAGPFSIFPHVDRTMFILRGGRLILEGLSAGPALLTAASPAFVFPGDSPVMANVPDGPIDNLNLMIDRRRFSSAARRLPQVETNIEPRGIAIVYCEEGEIAAIASEEVRTTLGQGDALTTRDPIRLAGDGRAIVLEVWPL